MGGTTPVAAELAFDRYEVVPGSANRQTVLTGFFLDELEFLDGDFAQLALVDIDENGDRRLRIYAFGNDGAADWTPRLDATLGSGVFFVDVINIGGRDRLITYERVTHVGGWGRPLADPSGRLNWFDPDSATERELVEVGSDYNAADKSQINATIVSEIPHVDITRDLNHDGRDDLIVPDVDGFWTFIQLSDGSFADAVKLGPPEPFLDETPLGASKSYREIGITASTIPWYLSRVHEMDYDGDGRSDLVFWNEDHFDVYRQDARGMFGEVSETFTPDVPFDADGAYSLSFGLSDVSAFKLMTGFKAKTRRAALHSFRDLNGDGVTDLVIQTLEGRSLLRQRSLYEVHFGSLTPEGTSFARAVDTAIQPRGRAAGLQASGYSSQSFQDLDGDGQVDIMFRDLKIGIGGMLRAVLGNSVPLNLEFYRIEDGTYPERPTTSRRIRRFAPLAGLGNVFFPTVLMGDMNGDGRSDLVVGHSPEELHVFVGVPGPDPLARKPQKVAIALPYDERNSWLVDLNRDGKQDLLMHHTPTEHAPTAPYRLTMLIAR